MNTGGGKKRKTIAFDCGVLPLNEKAGGPVMLGVDAVFLSHTHVDHCAALISVARAKGGTLTCYCPASAVAALTALRDIYAKLDAGDPCIAEPESPGPAAAGAEKGRIERNPFGLTIVGVPTPEPGTEVEVATVGGGYTVTAFATDHRIDSLGYVVRSTRKGSILPELKNHKEKIAERAKQGLPIYGEPTVTVDIVYTGDTTGDGLVPVPVVWQARLLIMECTFFTGVSKSSKDAAFAKSRGHIHSEDVASFHHRGLLDATEQLLLVHFSTRYTGQVRELAKAELPEALHPKVVLALGAMGGRDCSLGSLFGQHQGGGEAEADDLTQEAAGSKQ